MTKIILIEERDARARAVHRCVICGELIRLGDRYRRLLYRDPTALSHRLSISTFHLQCPPLEQWLDRDELRRRYS